MSIAVDVATEGVRVPVARTRVAALAEGVLRRERVRDALLSIAFVTDRRIAALNRAHLGHDGPTDVISFGFAPVDSRRAVVGDVYIAPGVARRHARAHGGGCARLSMVQLSSTARVCEVRCPRSGSLLSRVSG